MIVMIDFCISIGQEVLGIRADRSLLSRHYVSTRRSEIQDDECSKESCFGSAEEIFHYIILSS
jgi:hypothetical protein